MSTFTKKDEDLINNIKVGDTFYCVEKYNNTLSRKKLYKVIEGQTWFKYNKPNYSFHLNQFTVLGVLTKSLEGVWADDQIYELDTQIFVRVETPSKNYTTTMCANDINCIGCFIDKNKAIEHIKMLGIMSFDDWLK